MKRSFFDLALPNASASSSDADDARSIDLNFTSMQSSKTKHKCLIHIHTRLRRLREVGGDSRANRNDLWTGDDSLRDETESMRSVSVQHAHGLLPLNRTEITMVVLDTSKCQASFRRHSRTQLALLLLVMRWQSCRPKITDRSSLS